MRERGHRGPRRKPRRLPVHVCLLLLFLCVAAVWFFVVSAPPRVLDAPPQPELHLKTGDSLFDSEGSLPSAQDGGERMEQPAEADMGKKEEEEDGGGGEPGDKSAGAEIERKGNGEEEEGGLGSRTCATVEEMGEGFSEGSGKESLRVRELIQQHFTVHGICSSRFPLPALAILVLTKLHMPGAASVRGLPPDQFCRRGFVIGKASEAGFGNEMYKILTSAALSVMFQGTTDAVASQFFLKNIHVGMKHAALSLFGEPGSLQARPNVFGELMRILISPSKAIEEAVNWVLKGSTEPDVTLHMRMMSNRSIRAIKAALNCVQKAVSSYQQQLAKPRVVLVSDTPPFIKDITPNLTEFAESGFRVKDWGPAPRWVAFVDFFLASHAKHAVISGAHRRVGTTYAQLIAALAASSHLGDNASPTSGFSFFSSFQRNLLAEGLGNQIGWGHAWNRFAGPLSCRWQPHQCAFTPLLPSAWWDSRWQSPIRRDIRRMKDYGVQLTNTGEVVESSLLSFCERRKEIVRTLPIVNL
ncbi:hypothetical protein Taro_039397 [Colocasia esculenta]|uniref:Uncharacterized protein n=1 Tax=Colocasia esculenta TaxID=4460 RepID=A0A843WVN0_COLES|nr:hypothetical protein [Colocasia esculenta]